MLLKMLIACVTQRNRFVDNDCDSDCGDYCVNSCMNDDVNGVGFGRAEKGLTLLECVVAIAVIALTGAMIGPPLVMAAATRVQSRRAEQAMQLAQGEVDRISAMVIQGKASTGELLPKAVSVPNLEAQGAPDTFWADASYLRSPNTNCNEYEATNAAHVAPANVALPVDVNGLDHDDNCKADFYIQSFRQDQGLAASAQGADDGIVKNFQLMVRVYSAQAKDQEPGTLGVKEAKLSFTSGGGEYWTKPLAVLSTRISSSDVEGALCTHHKRERSCQGSS